MLPAGDYKRLLEALDRLKAEGDLISLRTRAFVRLLLDGALIAKAALELNVEEVVRNPAAPRIRVQMEVHQRPNDSNRYRGRDFLMTEPARQALADYIKVARAEGWFRGGKKPHGPLFVSTQHHGTGQRLKRLAAIAAWKTFQAEYLHGRECDYNVDDLVETGRTRFAKAAGGDTKAISEHTSISSRSAAKYAEHGISAQDAVERLSREG